MKTLTLVTKGKNTHDTLLKQLHDLLGDLVNIEGYYVEGNIKPLIGQDLIVASSALTLTLAEEYLNPRCPRIVALRSVNYQEIESLINLPPMTQALLVNDTLSAALDMISYLNTVGLNHIEYFPYFPGITDFPGLKLAITPGEIELVPEFVETVIDIKNRNIDFITLVEILRALSLLDEKANLLSAKYVSGIMDLLKKNRQIAELNKHMRNQLEMIINTVRDGVIALDDAENITVFNLIAEELLGYPQEKITGKNLADKTIEEDFRALLTNAENGLEYFAKVNGRNLVVRSSSIAEDNNKAGRVFTFNDVTEIQRLEENHRRELVSQANYARYTFAHILGDSQLLTNTKVLAQKIAHSDSPILIQGESGTGKELFAQGIHNASPRNKGPFIAVNFAELSESLLESELFGYEEGAFTGAKKGGRFGLFQQAHKGTIFLDEIGDAPLSFQVKLLRVLQEKQVRRIGSSRVTPIDVRVIVATNRNLRELIDKDLFRQDLYYRLNVLPIKLPSLRERKQDIMTLAKHFFRKYFNNHPIINSDKYFQEIQESFQTYDWPGNIRELQNVVEFLVNIYPDLPPRQEMLPEELRNIKDSSLRAKADLEENRYSKILELIATAIELGKPIGRRSLALKTGSTEGIIRGILQNLEVKGYLIIRKGVKGLSLTPRGLEKIKVNREI